MTGRRHEALSELAIFALAYVVYFGVRAVTEGTAAAATRHAFDLVIFALFPVAPPRLTDLPLVDTVIREAEGYRQVVPPALVNQYAAMPSFHAGWNVLLGIVVFRATGNWLLRALAVAGPAAMALAVVATANHFVVDVIAGIAIVLAGLAVLRVAERVRRRRTLVRAHEYKRAGAVRRRTPGRERSPAPPGGGGATARAGRG